MLVVQYFYLVWIHTKIFQKWSQPLHNHNQRKVPCSLSQFMILFFFHIPPPHSQTRQSASSLFMYCCLDAFVFKWVFIKIPSAAASGCVDQENEKFVVVKCFGTMHYFYFFFSPDRIWQATFVWVSKSLFFDISATFPEITSTSWRIMYFLILCCKDLRGWNEEKKMKLESQRVAGS